MKLELGCGARPTPGYVHNDLNPFGDVDHVGSAKDIELPSGSLDEVLALGVIEHLSYQDALATFTNVARMLKPGGEFLFDVPDFPVWCRYAADHYAGNATPFPIDHVRRTIYGWQRWPGDEHKFGWDRQLLEEALGVTGFATIGFGVEAFLARGHERQRMFRPEDAHLYVVAAT